MPSSTAARGPTWQTVAEEHSRFDQHQRDVMERLRRFCEKQEALESRVNLLRIRQEQAAETRRTNRRKYGGKPLFHVRQKHSVSAG